MHGINRGLFLGITDINVLLLILGIIGFIVMLKVLKSPLPLDDYDGTRGLLRDWYREMPINYIKMHRIASTLKAFVFSNGVYILLGMCSIALIKALKHYNLPYAWAIGVDVVFLLIAVISIASVGHVNPYKNIKNSKGHNVGKISVDLRGTYRYGFAYATFVVAIMILFSIDYIA